MRRLALLAAAALCLSAPRAEAQLPPDARWSTLETPNFRVHFTPGLETLARRAADRAEDARAEIAAVLVEAPRGKIDLVVSDNVDYSNGYATPLPTNRVVVFANPPVGEPELAFYDDWLDLVVSHELVHVFQLDYARRLPRTGRSVFGRAPFTFPHLFTPGWTKEGLATVLESRLTRAGRVRGTLQEMALRTAILEDRFFTIDRASGYPVSWPAGSTPYVYGAQFMEWLADRHGPEAHGRWVREVGGRVIPYRMDHTARQAYGETFTRAWDAWRDSLSARFRAQADSLRGAGLTEPEILTRAGRRVDFPRWSPDGSVIAFAASDGRSEPATRLVSPGGAVRHHSARNSLGPASWAADGGLVTAMLETRGPFHHFSDLYRLEADGSRRRLTRGARYTEPDVSRADGAIVAIRNGGGTNVPVVLRPDGTGERPLVEASLDVHWATPRWSPDGTRVALSRWRAGGYYDVVVLDAATGRMVREVTRDRAVDATPAWSPDGRFVLFSSDRSGIANLYAYDLASGELRQATRVLTGAFHPDVSPDGRWIALTVYRADGYHVARIPFDPSTWHQPAPLREEARGPGEDAAASQQTAAGEVRPYSAWRSARPAAWVPFLESDDELGTGLGAAVGGQDVVARHSWAAYGQVRLESGRTEGAASYLYAGLGRPLIGASVLQDWDAFATDAEGGLLLERERAASLVATWTMPRFRSFRWVSLGVGTRDRDYSVAGGASESLAPPIPAEVGGAATLGVSRTRAYEYSISQERGWVAAATAEGRRYVQPIGDEAEPRGYLRFSGRSHGYQPLALGGFSRHALAVRLQGGGVTGQRPPLFHVGGIGSDPIGYPLSTFVSIGSAVDLPLRGYDSGVQSGDRAVAGSAEYRFPVALVERGYRLVPVYLDRVWGALFADAAAAWCVEACAESSAVQPARPDPLASIGGELGVNAGLFFLPPVALRFGAALPLQRDVPGGAEPKLYFTVGRSH